MLVVRSHQARERVGHVVHARAEARNAAAVGPDDDLVAWHAAEARDVVEHQLLDGMLREPVSVRSHSELQREREHAGVLARAVAVQCRRLLAGAQQGVRGLGIERQVRSALEVVHPAPDALEQRRDALHVHALAAVGRSGERDVLGGEAEPVRRAARDDRHRLERLGRRAPVGEPHARLAYRVKELPVRRHDRDVAAMKLVHHRTARHLDERSAHASMRSPARTGAATRFFAGASGQIQRSL